MEVYSHRQLDPELNSIRLLRLHKTLEGSPIVLSIRHASLDDNEPFNALSYAWGDESPLHDVVIHDGDKNTCFSIRQNLYDFLLTARKSEEDWSEKWIWIDQISINQSDHEERCHQVAQMGRIYSTASSTIVWPGLTTQENDSGSDLASSTLLCGKDEVEVIRNTPVAMFKHRDFKPALPSESAVRLLSKVTSSLLRAPYWSRLWIIQEIVIAEQVYVVIAGQIWDFSDFLLVLAMLSTRLKCPESNLERHIAENVEHLRDRSDAIWFQHRFGKLDMGFRTWALAFILATGTKCTSPLDQVYGVMALVRKELHVYPDYSISQRQLLRTIFDRLLSSAPFRAVVWDAMFEILACWTILLRFETVESMRDIPADIFLDLSIDVKIKKCIVSLVLNDLELPRPTIIMNLENRLYWKMASAILLRSYVHRTDIDICFSDLMETKIDGLDRWSLEGQVLYYTRLQQHLIKEAGKSKYAPWMTRFRRKIVLSATHQDLNGRARRARSVKVQKISVNKTNMAGNAMKIQGHLPTLLIKLMADVVAPGTISDDDDGDYNTGILLP